MMQGMLRYAYRADLANGIVGPKEIAKGWVFARGVLPPIHCCNANAAASVRQNMDISAATSLADRYRAVKQIAESEYGCMGINCADVGGLLEENDEYYGGMASCGCMLVSFLLTMRSQLLARSVPKFQSHWQQARATKRQAGRTVCKVAEEVCRCLF